MATMLNITSSHCFTAKIIADSDRRDVSRYLIDFLNCYSYLGARSRYPIDLKSLMEAAINGLGNQAYFFRQLGHDTIADNYEKMQYSLEYELEENAGNLSISKAMAILSRATGKKVLRRISPINPDTGSIVPF